MIYQLSISTPAGLPGEKHLTQKKTSGWAIKAVVRPYPRGTLWLKRRVLVESILMLPPEKALEHPESCNVHVTAPHPFGNAA